MRAFVGIPIEGKVNRDISTWAGGLAGGLPGVKWVEGHNLHITLRFLDEISNSQATGIARMLSGVALRHSPFLINVEGAGVFPDRGDPKVVWVGVKGNGLKGLYESINSALLPLGWPDEVRPFRPHVTVGRFRYPASREGVLSAISTARGRLWGEIPVEQFCLFKSVLTPSGPVYTVLDRFVLK